MFAKTEKQVYLQYKILVHDQTNNKSIANIIGQAFRANSEIPSEVKLRQNPGVKRSQIAQYCLILGDLRSFNRGNFRDV